MAAAISIIILIYSAVLNPCINGEAINLGIKLLAFIIFKDELGISEVNEAGTWDKNVDTGFIPRNAENRKEEAGIAANCEDSADGTFNEVNCV